VSVGWAPTGSAFFVTDFKGSDSSDCLVFVLGGGAPDKRDLSNELRSSGLVPPKTWSNHHVSCEVLRWTDE
jgi:hypothetical protein